MMNNQYVVGLHSASTDHNLPHFVILIMSSIKHKKVHPHGVATMDQYFDHITEVVAETFKKEEDDEASSTDSFSNHSYEIYIDSNGTERVRYNRYLNSEYPYIVFSNYSNYSNYYNYYKTLFITITMINMKTSSIKLMSNQKTEKVSTFKPYIKASEFPEGVIKTFFIVKIVELEQEFQGVKKMEDVTKVNLETGEETPVTQPAKGYELTLVDVDDKEQIARLLSVNAKAGVQFVDHMVENRSKPIGTFIAGEKIELEKVQNDFGYNPSILPVGA